MKKNRISNWRARLHAQGRMNAPGPQPKDARFAGAIQDEVRCMRDMPRGSVLVGVEFGIEYVNAVMADFAGLEEMSSVFGTSFLEGFAEAGIPRDPRNAVQSWVLDRMKDKTYADDAAVVTAITWLMLADPKLVTILAAPSKKSMIDGLRYVVTDTGNVDPKLGKEMNWRLYITFAPSREEAIP
jgi:hypothetical protein